MVVVENSGIAVAVVTAMVVAQIAAAVVGNAGAVTAAVWNVEILAAVGIV